MFNNCAQLTQPLCPRLLVSLLSVVSLWSVGYIILPGMTWTTTTTTAAILSTLSLVSVPAQLLRLSKPNSIPLCSHCLQAKSSLLSGFVLSFSPTVVIVLFTVNFSYVWISPSLLPVVLFGTISHCIPPRACVVIQGKEFGGNILGVCSVSPSVKFSKFSTKPCHQKQTEVGISDRGNEQ